MNRIFTFFAAALFTLMVAAQSEGDRIIGNYMSKLSNNDAKAKIFKYNGGYRMQIYWLRDTHNPDGTLKTDSKNPDKAKRNIPMTEVVLVDRVTYQDGIWTNGRIYDPKSGKDYKTELRLKGNTLELRGIAGPFHKDIIWTRIK